MARSGKWGDGVVEMGGPTVCKTERRAARERSAARKAMGRGGQCCSHSLREGLGDRLDEEAAGTHRLLVHGGRRHGLDKISPRVIKLV